MGASHFDYLIFSVACYRCVLSMSVKYKSVRTLKIGKFGLWGRWFRQPIPSVTVLIAAFRQSVACEEHISKSSQANGRVRSSLYRKCLTGYCNSVGNDSIIEKPHVPPSSQLRQQHYLCFRTSESKNRRESSQTKRRQWVWGGLPAQKGPHGLRPSA